MARLSPQVTDRFAVGPDLASTRPTPRYCCERTRRARELGATVEVATRHLSLTYSRAKNCMRRLRPSRPHRPSIGTPTVGRS